MWLVKVTARSPQYIARTGRAEQLGSLVHVTDCDDSTPNTLCGEEIRNFVGAAEVCSCLECLVKVAELGDAVEVHGSVLLSSETNANG